MEPCKKSFFTKEFTEFQKIIEFGKFQIYSGTYNYHPDHDGKPLFIVNNFLNGLVYQLDNQRKYLFVVFVANRLETGCYELTSNLITNCTLELSEVLGTKYDDFTWSKVENPVGQTIQDSFNIESGETTLVAYLH